MTSEQPDGRPADASRRQFLKQATGAAVSVAFLGLGVPGLLGKDSFPAIAEAGGAIAVDPSLCIGCLTCEVACSDVHRDAGLSDLPRIRIYNLDSVRVNPEVIRAFGDRGRFAQQVCLQCPDAPCLPVCPVDALQVDSETGARVINRDTCIDCGKCEKSCIFPTLDEALATGQQTLGQRSRITRDERLDVYTKCDLCYFREEGPACVELCPVNIRINQKQLASDVLCLDVIKPVNTANFAKLQAKEVAPGEVR